jgi:hypothetical protein
MQNEGNQQQVAAAPGVDSEKDGGGGAGVVAGGDGGGGLGGQLLPILACMVPFSAFCYGHARGMTGRVVERVVRSPVGAGGLLLLPFVTLAVEKSIYDTVQAAQGINPNVRPADRGGFPSGGANLPSFALIAVRQRQQHDNRSNNSSTNKVLLPQQQQQ